jgi:hypothetical protein
MKRLYKFGECDLKNCECLGPKSKVHEAQLYYDNVRKRFFVVEK